MPKIAQNIDFWRENSKIVAHFTRNIIKGDYLSDFQTLVFFQLTVAEEFCKGEKWNKEIRSMIFEWNSG